MQPPVLLKIPPVSLVANHAAAPRLILPGIPLHIIQRGNNRSVCFHAEEDSLFYLDWLARTAHDTGCAPSMPIA